ncbi:MAG: 4Fe-4S cluster-binding domain-containing protein [Cytophagales bacterium]|nr:4Fe-4S cluster-binding domain-containing protein [Cytophagales bacterium]
MSQLKSYLEDPFLYKLYEEIRRAGSLRSISVDLTSECNLRCKGCYYFEEGMDKITIPDEKDFDDFIEREKSRGTNFVTIVGGEPSMVIPRVKKIYNNFNCNVATNGLIKIPYEGLENLPIGVSIWGNQETDSSMRANGKRDLFGEALTNYKEDPRAFWYYAVAPGYANEIEEVVTTCVNNGNRVLFNYYSDLTGLGGKHDYREGFDEVRKEIDRMIEMYPDKILMTSYFNKVISTGELLGEKWGYDVCTNLSTDYKENQERLEEGNLFNPHFRAYNADFSTTRRCCTGVDRSCDSCFDTWEHFSWVMVNLKKHLGSKEDFANWLTTMYLFYFINGLLNK